MFHTDYNIYLKAMFSIAVIMGGKISHNQLKVIFSDNNNRAKFIFYFQSSHKLVLVFQHNYMYAEIFNN